MSSSQSPPEIVPANDEVAPWATYASTERLRREPYGPEPLQNPEATDYDTDHSLPPRRHRSQDNDPSQLRSRGRKVRSCTRAFLYKISHTPRTPSGRRCIEPDIIGSYTRWLYRCHPDRMRAHDTHLTIIKNMKNEDNTDEGRIAFKDIDKARLERDVSDLRAVVDILSKDGVMMMRRRALPYLTQSLIWKIELQHQYEEWEERKRRETIEAQMLSHVP